MYMRGGKKACSFVLALLLCVSTLFVNTSVGKAAETKKDVLLEENGTATANTEVSHNFTIDKNTNVNFYLFSSVAVNCKVGIYNSADVAYDEKSITSTDWKTAEGIYGVGIAYTDMPAGDYTVKATFDADTEYIVAVEAEKILATINVKSATLTVGFTKKLKVDNTKETVTWSSSKKSVATVNSKGVVTAKKPGSATITAKTKDGQKLTCKIKVKANTYKETKMSISDVGYGRSGLQVYNASYAKNGDLVMKCRFLNNYGYKANSLKNVKIVFKTDAGKTIGTYKLKSKSMTVATGSTKDFTVTLKKSKLKIKKADLRNATYSSSGTAMYTRYY